MDQYDNVLKEYDAVVLSGLSSENTFGLVDASSLLWRLEVRVCVRLGLCVRDIPTRISLCGTALWVTAIHSAVHP